MRRVNYPVEQAEECGRKNDRRHDTHTMLELMKHPTSKRELLDQRRHYRHRQEQRCGTKGIGEETRGDELWVVGEPRKQSPGRELLMKYECRNDKNEFQRNSDSEPRQIAVQRTQTQLREATGLRPQRPDNVEANESRNQRGERKRCGVRIKLERKRHREHPGVCPRDRNQCPEQRPDPASTT